MYNHFESSVMEQHSESSESAENYTNTQAIKLLQSKTQVSKDNFNDSVKLKEFSYLPKRMN